MISEDNDFSFVIANEIATNETFFVHPQVKASSVLITRTETHTFVQSRPSDSMFNSTALHEKSKALGSQSFPMPSSPTLSMVVPIKTTLALGPDNRPVSSYPAISSTATINALKSVKILKTLWGDLASDEQSLEGSDDQNIDVASEEDILYPTLYTPCVSKRKKNKHKLQHNKGTSNEGIQTRSKKGISH